jgi:hypothetical protein
MLLRDTAPDGAIETVWRSRPVPSNSIATVDPVAVLSVT